MVRWRRLRILIVEDDAVVALALRYAIEDAGHEVVANEARYADAIEAAERLKPDVALVDLTLHEGCVGVNLARHFARRGKPLVIVVTARPEELPPDLAGAYGLLRKPVPARLLVSTLEFVAAGLAGVVEPKPDLFRLATK